MARANNSFLKKNLINTDQTLSRKVIQKKTIKVLTDNTIKQHTVSSKEHWLAKFGIKRCISCFKVLLYT